MSRNLFNVYILKIGKKKMTLACIVVLMMTLLAGCVQKSSFSDFPEMFKENSLIVVGNDSSESELQAAYEIAAYLENKTGNKPLVKKYPLISNEERKNYNLIIVGIPKNNKMFGEVYDIKTITQVNETFPGAGRGVIEISRNPWNDSKSELLVAGSDEWGVKAGILMIEDRKISDKIEFSDWTKYTNVKFPIDNQEEAIAYAKTDFNVRDYIKYFLERGYKIESWANWDAKEKDWAAGFEVKPLEDAWYYIIFNENGTIISKGIGRI